MANENPPGFSDNTSIFSEKEARLSDDVVFDLRSFPDRLPACVSQFSL
jgi:hypothetical protein